MSDMDEEMKTGEVHTGEDVSMTDAQQQPTTDAAVDTDAASWRYPTIDCAEHVGEQQQAARHPHIQHGVWRATRGAAYGASVLLTTHSDVDNKSGEDTTTAAAATAYERLVQSHPHLVIFYGARNHVFVCEDGKRFCDFVASDGSYKSVASFLRCAAGSPVHARARARARLGGHPAHCRGREPEEEVADALPDQWPTA